MSSVQELLRPAIAADTAHRVAPRRDLMPHPVVMMILIIAAAMLLSWLIPSGQFDRAPNGHVIAGSFREIPKQLGPPVPPGLWAIIQRCLAKEPAQRYQRASEIQAALEAVQSGAIVSEAANDQSDRLRYLSGADAKRLWPVRRWLGYRAQMKMVKRVFKL